MGSQQHGARSPSSRRRLRGTGNTRRRAPTTALDGSPSPGGGNGSLIFRRSLNRDGNGWAEGDWSPLNFSPWYRLGDLVPGARVSATSYLGSLFLFAVDVNGDVRCIEF